MKERPIIFSGEMVQAILDGRKTQTRRVMKLQPLDTPLPMNDGSGWVFLTEIYPNHGKVGRCRYGIPGDRLWVRETCNISDTKDAVMYLGNGGKLGPTAPADSENWCRTWKTCPSIHMPRWASRITLEIVNVRVEMVKEISEKDAEAEGVCATVVATTRTDDNGDSVEILTAIAPFSELWDSINAKRGYGWDANPWVWVIEFKKVD